MFTKQLKHNWIFNRRELGNYGMGIEWFDIYKCKNCSREADRLENTNNELLIDSTYSENTILCVTKDTIVGKLLRYIWKVLPEKRN